jgi:V/A-type H+/Na+-transporting ATPase subunit I
MLRPVRARWFELLSSREDLPLAVETLSRTGSVELEACRDGHPRINMQDLREGLLEFSRLARRYQPYWPAGEPVAGHSVIGPIKILNNALRRLRAWETAAAPVIRRLEVCRSEQSELRLLDELLRQFGEDSPDFTLLTAAGPVLQSRVFVLPPAVRLDPLPDAVLHLRVRAQARDFLLAVGQPVTLDVLTAELAERKSRVLRLPASLPQTAAAAGSWVGRRLAQLDREIGRLHQRIEALSGSHYLAMTLGELQRLAWFLGTMSSVPVSENFAWVTGWTDDTGGERLSAALQQAQLDAMMHFPQPPRKLAVPLVLRNPWWARPFEVFARMLGTPAVEEADPSPLLAVLTPLLFGYMFGDVGQGLVLLVVGVALQRRTSLTRLLIPYGLSAMVFGWVFGSVFGQDGWIAPLWANPVEQPLLVLLVPLAGGVFILLIGLVLNALQAAWRGELRRWVQVEAAVMVIYVMLVATVFLPAARYVVAGAVIWFFLGSLALQYIAGGGRFWPSLATAAGTLIESVLQLLLNTVSFVRVGAFALAHSGLSLTFAIMAAAVDSHVFGALILLLGNLIVILLEGLVVSIQSTRLILFEFFIRFLRGTGRTFRPLAAPEPEMATRRTT